MANNIVQDINDATNILLHTYMNLGIDTFTNGINSTFSKLNNVLLPTSPTSPASPASPTSPASPASPTSPASPASPTSGTRLASGTSIQQPNDNCDSISMDQLFINYINSV